MNTPYAVVTGASTGLGKAFAHELAQRKINLVLVSLPNEGLPELARQLKQTGIDAAYFETDLTKQENVINLADWINKNFAVSILINNAGMGGTKRFVEADISYLDKMMQLNVVSVTLMTRALLPNLMNQKKGYVLNVSSMAAFSPMGFKTVYPASKAFVYHFTRGLYQELKDTNVFVSVVNPGPMPTNKEVTERIKKQSLFARAGALTPEKVAAISIRQLFKRDTLIMLNYVNGFQWLLMKILPVWIRLPLLTNGIKRELKKQEYSLEASKMPGK